MRQDVKKVKRILIQSFFFEEEQMSFDKCLCNGNKYQFMNYQYAI